MSERANVCRCGCGKTRYFGRWYAKDCATQARKNRERAIRRLECQQLRRQGKAVGRRLKKKQERENADLSPEEIERRFAAYKAWQAAMRKREQAA